MVGKDLLKRTFSPEWKRGVTDGESGDDEYDELVCMKWHESEGD